MIPYGITVPPENSTTRPADGQRTLLFLSRLHPGKGLETLLQAWQRLAASFPRWHLKIAGPLEGPYPAEVQELARRLELPRVQFCGELRGEAKSAAYRQAELFILPSLSENFGFAIAEALAHGVPVITTQGTPWQELELNACGWWCKPDLASITQTMECAMQADAGALSAMGRQGRQWMIETYAWSQVGEKMCSVYMWLLGRAGMPACVITD
jgi:glycosyltransferase involved in cell wall biosynthesis